MYINFPLVFLWIFYKHVTYIIADNSSNVIKNKEFLNRHEFYRVKLQSNSRFNSILIAITMALLKYKVRSFCTIALRGVIISRCSKEERGEGDLSANSRLNGRFCGINREACAAVKISANTPARGCAIHGVHTVYNNCSPRLYNADFQAAVVVSLRYGRV